MNASQVLWNICAFSYARSIGHSLPHQEMFQRITDAITDNEINLVFDAGCGAGDLERLITMHGLPVHVHAVDFSSKMLANARKKCRENKAISFSQVDLDAPLPFADAHFDAVVCLQALFAVPRPECTLAELARVLRPGGRLVIVDPLPTSDMGQVVKSHLAQIRHYQGWRRIRAYGEVLCRAPFAVVVLCLNLIMGSWVRHGNYHFYTCDEWQEMLHANQLSLTTHQPILAGQDTLVIGQKIADASESINPSPRTLCNV